MAKTILMVVSVIFGAGWLALHVKLVWDVLRKRGVRQLASIPWSDVSGFASSDLSLIEEVSAETVHFSVAA